MGVLSIDTSGRICSLAAGRASDLIERTHPQREELSRRLPEWVADTLEAAGLTAGDIDRVVVGRGPGSWTGLRIGISFARAFAWARGCPLLGVPSGDALVESMDLTVAKRAYYVVPARKGVIWYARYDVRSLGPEASSIHKGVEESEVEAVAFLDLLEGDETEVVVGEGITLILHAAGTLGRSLDRVRILEQSPSALANARHASLRGDTAASPIYAAPSQAERRFGLPVSS